MKNRHPRKGGRPPGKSGPQEGSPRGASWKGPGPSKRSPTGPSKQPANKPPQDSRADERRVGRSRRHDEDAPATSPPHRDSRGAPERGRRNERFRQKPRGAGDRGVDGPAEERGSRFDRPPPRAAEPRAKSFGRIDTRRDARAAPGERTLKQHREREPAERPTQLSVYGRHAVAAALANPERPVKRVLATAGALDWLKGQSLPAARRSMIEEAEGREIDILLHEGAVHQGLVALVDDLPRARLRDACAPADPRRPVVVLDQITDPQNIGAIFRSAAAFGAKAIIVQDRRTPPRAGALAKAAAGAVEVLPCVEVVNVTRALEGLKDLGYYCAGLVGDAARDLGEIPADRPVALVLGAEGAGLRHLVAATCDGHFKIPIDKAVDSLNVSTAAAVALYAIARGKG